ncbi:glutathione-disulfide reductase [Rhodoferax saidenbachensis]|uniref:Glutathione-disulfide reductase n=1 Tax=Rhodoferax saidenbachensis TaxID=1484693 RepID=A0A1P8K9Z7_9BURK|nr:glutathione-disulfide reductase [Rhodoferax saidenbachensis]APW42819.1 glutathione-disulfide reductase [Rhodoferax saidenbachensis]
MAQFDLIVIGGGSGGVRAARIAANHGARVALVEEYRLGGTCVIRGCVPKKLMVYASRFAQEFEEAAGFGWTVDAPRFDWATLKTRRDAEVARLEGIYRSNLLASGVQIFEGRAVLMDAKTVQLSNGEQHQATHILIATGAKPAPGPAISGNELAIDSNGFFDLQALPERVVVQGAGYIALELACVLQLLGAQVTVVVRGEQILRGFDDEMRQHLAAEMAHSGLEFRFGREVQAISRKDGALQVQLDNGDTLPADCVLRALGRGPNTKGLGLEALGIALDKHGAIPVDAFSQTTVPGIYAVGDVTNRVNLTPMAIREGHAFADTVFGKTPRSVDHALVPTAVFTTPEAGVVGLTEQQALAQYPRLDVYRSTFRPLKATLSGHTGKMLLKLLVDRDTDRVLGFHAVGPDTGEMAQLVGVALQLQATKTALDATLAVHPTAAEELVTMRTPAVRHNL